VGTVCLKVELLNEFPNPARYAVVLRLGGAACCAERVGVLGAKAHLLHGFANGPQPVSETENCRCGYRCWAGLVSAGGSFSLCLRHETGSIAWYLGCGILNV